MKSCLRSYPEESLRQGSQPVPHPTVCQHRLQAEHAVAHVAVAQHVVAARVGRDGPADGGGAPRSPVRREQAVRRGRGLLHRLDGGA